MSWINWGNLNSKVIFVSLVLFLLGLCFSFGVFHMLFFPDYAPPTHYHGGKISLILVPLWIFRQSYQVLVENKVSEFRWGIILTILGPVILTIFYFKVHNPVIIPSILPIMILYYVYTDRELYMAAKYAPSGNGVSLISYILIIVNCFPLYLSYVASGLRFFS